ncbi:MAG: ribonuclease P protein component, partial [Terriglobales bacterium]
MSAEAPERGVEQPAVNAGASFPRSGRLLKHSDFERVYKQGRRHFSSHMTVFYLRPAQGVSPNGLSNGGARVGFTVGRVLG